MRIAAADGEPELIGDGIIGMHETRVRLRIDIVGCVIDIQEAFERHEIVHVAGLREVVQARDVIEPVVDRLAAQLEFLRELVLVLGVGDLLDGLRSAVQVDADVPLDLPVARDGLQVHRIRQRPVGRRRAAEHVVFCEARPGRVGRIDIAGLGVGEIPVQARRPGQQQIASRSADVAGASERHATRRESRARGARPADSGRGVGEAGIAEDHLTRAVHRIVEHARRCADAQVVQEPEDVGRPGLHTQDGVGQRRLILMRPIAGERDVQVVRGLPQQLAANDLNILAAVGAGSFSAGLRIRRLRVHDERCGADGGIRGVRHYALVTVASLRGHAQRGQEVGADRNVGGEREVASVEAAARRLSHEPRGIPWRVSDDADGAPDGVSAEQRALGAFENLDPVDVEEILIGADGAREINAVEVNAYTRIQVEREVVLADAADGGG